MPYLSVSTTLSLTLTLQTCFCMDCVPSWNNCLSCYFPEYVLYMILLTGFLTITEECLGEGVGLWNYGGNGLFFQVKRGYLLLITHANVNHYMLYSTPPTHN